MIQILYKIVLFTVFVIFFLPIEINAQEIEIDNETIYILTSMEKEKIQRLNSEYHSSMKSLLSIKEGIKDKSSRINELKFKRDSCVRVLLGDKHYVMYTTQISFLSNNIQDIKNRIHSQLLNYKKKLNLNQKQMVLIEELILNYETIKSSLVIKGVSKESVSQQLNSYKVKRDEKIKGFLNPSQLELFKSEL